MTYKLKPQPWSVQRLGNKLRAVRWALPTDSVKTSW